MSDTEAAYYKGRLAIAAGVVNWFLDDHITQRKNRLSERSLTRLHKIRLLFAEIGAELDAAMRGA